MQRVAVATVILSVVSLGAWAQPPRENSSASPARTRTITGRVVANETGDPIANARVAVSTTGTGAAVVLTNSEGRFTLQAPLSRVVVVANKSSYGRREATVSAADQSVEIRLSHGAAISGRVVDEIGDPVIGVRVFVEKAGAQSDGFTGEAAASTDDRGDYRLGGLPAGTYNLVVLTIGPPTRREIGPNQFIIGGDPETTYYPGVTSAGEAEPLRLQPGDERSGIDVVVPGGQSMGQMGVMMSPIPPTPAPGAPPRTGVIRGRVVSTDGRSLAHAQVRTTMRATAAPNDSGRIQFLPVMATADEEGRYELSELPAGSFRVSAMKVGYSPPEDPSVRIGIPGPASGVTVDLSDGETRERVDLRLARWGAMTGHVVDELGDPLQGASVQLLQVRYQGGRRRLVGAGGAMNPTDDLGRYRIAGLPPGQYIVSATVGGVQTADLPGYQRSYFPGTPNASEAQFASLALSQETAGIDFSLSRARTARISGTILNAAGELSAQGSVRLMPSQRSSAVTSVSVGARLMPDGKFEFPNVTPGQYIVQVDRGRKNSSVEGEFGALPVAVDGIDITGLVVQTSAGSSITGRFTFDSSRGANPPRRNQFELTPVPIDADQSPALPANADIRDDWSFAISGVNGPRRLQLQRAPAGWALKEIRVRGTDITDRAVAFGTRDQSLDDVEVVLTDRINEISGTVVDDHAKPAPGAHVVLFAGDRDRWYPSSRFMRRTVAGSDGTISLAGLPAGSYYAAAVTQLPADGDDAWTDPAFLETLVTRAVSFTLGDGQKQSLNLKLPAPGVR